MQLLDHVEAERRRAHAVHDAVVEAHGDVAYLPDGDLTVSDDRAVGDAVEAEDRDLGMVDERA